MSTRGAVSASDRSSGRTPAQIFCLIGGLLALAFGALGFLVNGSFEDASFGFDFSGEDVHGDLFLAIEVNGWANVVNIAAGLLLLVGGLVSRGAARAMAIVLGIVYAVIAIFGWLDGNDVLGVMVTNTLGNIAYTAFAAVALVAGALSPSGEDDDAIHAPREREVVEAEPRYERTEAAEAPPRHERL